MTIGEIKTMSAAEIAKQLQEAMVDIATVFAGLLQVLNTLSQKKAR